MLDNFRMWYLRNYTEITWFVIGFLVMAGLTDASRGDWTGAVISFGIAYINYIFSKK